jgi:CheY-like chemotaxis protein
MFSQVKPARDRSDGGLGIGLALSRGLVELHGGRIRAESDGDGYGSTFIVSLPVSSVTEIVAMPEAKPPGAAGVEPKRDGLIVIVDDAIDTLVSIEMLLERSGYRVETASNVAAAIELVRRVEPDAIVSDLGMPDQDGFDLLRIVRNDQSLASIPVIALTGFATMHDRETALEAGFTAHLPKPVELPVLLAVIDRLIEEQRKEGEVQGQGTKDQEEMGRDSLAGTGV